MRLVAILAPLAGVLGLLVIGALAWRVTDLQREVEALSSSSPQPASSLASSGAPEPAASEQAPSPRPTATGSAEVGGAVWYPATIPDNGSIVVAPADAPESALEHADVVVSGTADDEINAALAELASTDGGQVTLLAGVFELGQPIEVDGDGQALVGTNVGNGAGYQESALGSMLVPAESFPDGEYLVRTTAEAYGPMISLLHLDGLDRAQGLSVESRRPTVTLNAVSQSSGVGMRFAGESTGNRPYDGFVLFNRVFDGGGIGILHDERSGDMLIEGNVVFRNQGDGFRCFGASQMYRVNHAYNNAGAGLRIIPGCVRTRLSSNKWEGNALGGISIEGGSGYTIVGDTFAHNEADQPEPPSHIEIGVRGDVETIGVFLWGLSFGKGDDENSHLVHVGSLGREVHLGPVHEVGARVGEPYRVDPGGELFFYEDVPDLVVE